MRNTLKFKKKKQYYDRVLREFRGIARVHHYCIWCCVPICPGDSYEARVIVCGRKLRVEKHHTPECPEDPEGKRAEQEADWLAELDSFKGRDKRQNTKQIA